MMQNKENIDNVEKEYVYEILVNMNKLIKQLKYNKWTDALCQAIITGDYNGFLQRFKMVMVCLRKRKPMQYQTLSNQALAAFIAQGITQRFYDIHEHTTILMILLANYDRESNCAAKGHGYCRIAHAVLKLLDRKEKTKLLEVTALRSGKTVLHLTVATGHTCQLRVLLTLANVNPNAFDKSGRSAIHYAIERNNIDMVKMLMWYGADISMVQAWNSKYSSIYLSMLANPDATVNHWLQERVKAISRKVHTFTKVLCSRYFFVNKDISSVHFVRVVGNSNHMQIESQLNLHTKVDLSPKRNQKQSQKLKTWAILFMVPIVFRTSDQNANAADPKIVRVRFPEDICISGQPILDRPRPPDSTAQKLHPIFDKFHNGLFYAYQLPDSIEGLYRLSIRINNTTDNNIHDNIILAIQAYLCNELNRSKSKMD